MEFSNFRSQVLDEISNDIGPYSENKENIQNESEQKYEKKVSLDNSNFESKNNDNIEIIRNNSLLSMDVSKLQINIEELKSQIKILEEENNQKYEQIQSVLQQQFQDKELINLVMAKNKILEQQDENRLKDFEKELVNFLAEQEIQMKNIFQDEIKKMCEVQEQMQKKIDQLECEKLQIVKLNQRLLKNENFNQEQRKQHFSISQEEKEHNQKYQTDRELAINKGKQYERSLDGNKRNKHLQENQLQSIKFENSCKNNSTQLNEVCSTKNSYYFDQNKKQIEEFASIRQNTEYQENINQKNQNMINELLKIYQVQDENQIIQCAIKTEKVMKTVPKLEFMLSQICSLILGKNKNQLDMLLPALTEMVNKINFGHKIYSEHAYTCKVFAIGEDENFFNSIQMIKQAIDEYLDFLIKIKKFLNVSPEEYNLKCLQKIWQILQQNSEIQQQQQYQIYE